MNILYRIIRKIEYCIAIRNSNNFISFLKKKGVDIGENCYFQSPKTSEVDITRPILISIGNNCRFLANFTLLTHDSVTKVFGPIFHEFIPSSGAVTIGNNVYFARNCSVLKGVTIGDNCIIGFGSTVTHDIPSNSVAAGTPAKVICTIEEYYNKRKKQSLEEAKELARIIRNKTGEKPTINQMYEEFPFWMEGEQDDPRLKFSVKYQTRGFYDNWKKNHRATYKSFEDFLNDALKQN